MARAVTVKLILPAELGAALLANKELRQLVEETPDVEIKRLSTADRKTEGLHDFGATAIAIVCAPAVVAAVKGLFKLFHIIAEKTYELRKLKMEQEHELRKMLLRIDHRNMIIPLDQGPSVIVHAIENGEKLVIERLEVGRSST